VFARDGSGARMRVRHAGFPARQPPHAQACVQPLPLLTTSVVCGHRFRAGSVLAVTVLVSRGATTARPAVRSVISTTGNANRQQRLRS
jgi:hypothetical protein